MKKVTLEYRLLKLSIFPNNKYFINSDNTKMNPYYKELSY